MNRRLHAIETLRRIEERELDTIARDLCALRDARHQADQRVSTLEERAAHEARSSFTEALPYVGRFLASLRREQAQASAQSQALGVRIEGLRDQVIERFAAEKTYASLKDRMVETLHSQRVAREEAMLEDLTSAKCARLRQV